MNSGVLQRVNQHWRAHAVPLEVMFEVTHRCNLPCVHCYLPDHGDHGELSFDEVCGILDQLVEAGTVFLTLTGGEVLARRDFLEILDAAAARGFVIKVLTNGTLITDEVADHFARAGVLEVSISLYGTDAEIHDRVTEMPGSFARTMAGIERLRARGLHVVLKTPVLTHNGGLARDVHEFARQQNIPCNFNLAIRHKNNGDPGPLELALHRKAMVDLMSLPPFDEVLLEGEASESGPEPCNAGRTYCTIGPTGELKPCIVMPTVVGSLRERRFDELWHGDPFLARLRALEAEDLHTCRECGVKSACVRCPGIAMQRGQDVDGCDLAAKQIAQARVEARMRLRVVQ